MDETKKATAEPSLLKQAFLAVQEMQAKLDRAERRNNEPIAIVGMGCRFPGGAVDGESFWKLLREGRDAISTVPRERWDADAYYDPDPDQPGKSVTRSGAFIGEIDKFDARFFEIAPREAAGMDPQQRLALEVVWETLENAGYAPTSLHGSKTGVFLGIASNDYSQLNLAAGDAELLDAHYASGVAHSIATGRISYLLGLEGPSISLDTACSSSLVAVHLACMSLRAGDSTMALAGGVNLMIAPETTSMLSRVRMLSPGGRCNAFDDSADGFVRGEGCGFVALKTLSKARADGDRILAVIRGSAVNQDGASSSLTAPNGPSQVSLMRQALANAGVQASEVSYVEAHGTGTALGDPIELQALGAVYGAARPAEKPLLVASLKTNVGHLETAAGVGALIKAVLALGHGQIPAHLNLKRPTSHVRWDELRLAVPQKLTEWKSPRIAATSSFGFSGTNAHVIVGEAPQSGAARDESGWPLQILAVSAKSEAALRRVVAQYGKYLEENPATDLRDFCFTANSGRSHFSHRACFLATDVEAMEKQLAAFEPEARSVSGEAGRVGFLFTGQGSQYAGMGRELYLGSPVFREAMDRCAAAWKEQTGESLIDLLYPAEGTANALTEARFAQPALFAFEYALAELWRSWGIEPSVLLGHSLGEYVAAVIAGVFSMEDGLRLVCARARLMDTLKTAGAMRAISANVERVRAAIAGCEKEVSIAAVNAPKSVVISGAAEAVGRIAEKLEAEGVRTRALQVTHGFHSPLLEPILDEFEKCAGQVSYRAPRIRMISNLTGEAARAEEMATPKYWREHMRSTVLFHAGLEAALATGCETLIEIGPQPHLISLGKSTHAQSKVSWLPSARKARSAWLDILNAIETLYKDGAEIDWKALHRRSGHKISLPTYPFERQRHWFRQKGASAARPVLASSGKDHPLLGARVRSPLAEMQFESRIGPERPAYLGDHVVAGHRVVPAAAYLEMALAAAGEARSVTAVAFLRPCVFDEPQVLQCLLQGDGAGRTFAIYSQPERVDATMIQEPWILHATGEIVLDADDAIQRVDLEKIRRRCLNRSDAANFYAAFERNGANFGPSFRPLTRVLRGDGEALVEFELPSEIKASAGLYRIHPVALDACFQAAVALLFSGDGDVGAYVPAALESLRIFGDAKHLAAAHARLRAGSSGGGALTADVWGVDAEGNVLVAAGGLVLRPLGKDAGDAKADAVAKSLYAVEWVAVEPESAVDIAGTCVVVGCGDLASGVCSAFAKQGVRCVAGDGEREYDSLLRAAESSPVSDFIYVAPRVTADALHLSSDRAMEMEAESLGECLRITQALLRMEMKETPRLWIVTRGAQGPGLTNPVHSALWGFGRSVAMEHPEMRVRRIDLDPAREATAEELLRCLRAAETEDELALRGKEMFAPRLRPVTPQSASRIDSSEETNLRLELVNAGTLEGIESVPAKRQAPGPGEVEIQVAAAGLNFRDVLNVLGMYKGKSGPLGGECAGKVVRVGAGVESVRPGDEVVALGLGCFARFMTTRALSVWPKPRHLSDAAAVTIPIAFLTAQFALHSVAAIQPGERILIHAGAGGVGLAAIQIARNAGAIVFATAGSAEKRAYLASIGVEHVMDSRTLDFVREVRETTGEKGVDIVLNSLAGEFIDAGLETLAPGGRFVEMGVADIRSADSIAKVRPDVTYHPFNLAPALEAGDRVVMGMVAEIFRQFESGALEPLPKEIFSMEKARDAFRYMAQARHIGRVVICPEKAAGGDGIRKDGAYLVTGGLAGVGLAVAEWLGQRGAAQVIVMGRSAADEEATNAFDRMREAGAMVSVFQGDVGKAADVEAALALAESFPLRGVFHCASVLDDGALIQQNWSRFGRALAAKVEGACNLNRLTANSPLDHFVLFSSIAAVFGSPGQTNYAAANAFLDGLAQLRRSHGLPGLSIDWGAWSETGSAVRHGVLERGAKVGIGGMRTRDGLSALERLIAGGRAQVAVAPMDWSAYFANGGAGATRPFLSEVRRSDSRTARPADAADSSSRKKTSSWLPQLRAIPAARRQDLLMRLLTERVQATLGLSDAQEIDPTQPLQELGLDSLLSIELRNALSACFDRSLPATLLFNYPTLAALAQYISAEVLAEDTASAERKAPIENAGAARVDLVGDIETLSDEEVDRLLSARAMGSVQ